MGLRAKFASNNNSSSQGGNSAKCLLQNNNSKNSCNNSNHKLKHSNSITKSYKNSESNGNENIQKNGKLRTPSKVATITTYRSSSMSALLVAPCGSMRPQTLNVHNVRETPTQQTEFFMGYVFNFNFIFNYF